MAETTQTSSNIRDLITVTSVNRTGRNEGQDKGQGSNWPEKCKLPSICPKAMRPWGAPIMWVRADWWEVGPLDSG